MKFIKRGITIYVSAIGMIGFTLFMLEETFQCKQFAGWQIEKCGTAQDIKDIADSMQGTITTIRAINFLCGWMNPFTFIAYKQYADAAEMYTNAMYASAFAKEPELFAGQTRTISFTPQSVSGNTGRSGRIKVDFLQQPTAGKSYRIKVEITHNRVREIR